MFSVIILPQPWHLWLWAEPTLWDTFVLACSLSLEKIRNVHSGSISFPGNLNLPVWSVRLPNPWRVSHVTQCFTLSPCFWKRCLQRDTVGLSVPPESCIPPYSPPSPCGKSRTGSVQTRRQREGAGWENAGCVSWEQKEAKGRSPDLGLWVMF